MGNLPLRLVIRNYDFLVPLACGQVVAEGIDLDLQRDNTAMYRSFGDPVSQGGETSFSRHLIRLAAGDRSVVGLPIFISRHFRHRCFYVRRDSGLREIKDLAGKAIGTNEWPGTGNVWTRAILREQGIPIDGVQWWVGTVDDVTPICDQGVLPPFVRQAPPDRWLRNMLLEGELDALMGPHPPKHFYEPDSPIVRLLPDYRRAEQEYFARTGIFPTSHIIGVRRELYERHPWALCSIYDALEESKQRWQARRKKLCDASPWLRPDLEEATEIMGEDWWPHGIEANRHAIRTLCEEEHAQGFMPEPIDPATIFTEFEQVVAEGTRP